MKEIFEEFINEDIFIDTTHEHTFKNGRRFKITGAYDKFLELEMYSEYSQFNIYIPYTSIYYVGTTSNTVKIKLIDTINIGDKSFQRTIGNMQYNLKEIHNRDLVAIKKDVEVVKKHVKSRSLSDNSDILEKLDRLR